MAAEAQTVAALAKDETMASVTKIAEAKPKVATFQCKWVSCG